MTYQSSHFLPRNARADSLRLNPDLMQHTCRRDIISAEYNPRIFVSYCSKISMEYSLALSGPRTNHNYMTIHVPISSFEQIFYFCEQVLDRERFYKIAICSGANRDNFAIHVIKSSNNQYWRMLEFWLGA